MSSSTAWSGRVVTSARAYWKSRLPLPCHLCGGTVDGRVPWVVEHIVPRARGGDPSARSNQWVSHRRCSDRSGGRMAAAITNGARATVRSVETNERARGIRGL